MRDLQELNLDRDGMFAVPPPPTAQQLAVVESLIGGSLPAAYVAFLKFSNGGYPQLNSFYVERDGRQEIWNVNDFFHVSTDSLSTEDTEDVAWQYQHRWHGAARGILPIACNGMGDRICLDLTKGGNGRVVLWVHDEDWPLLSVAASFEEFVDSLTVDPDVG